MNKRGKVRVKKICGALLCGIVLFFTTYEIQARETNSPIFFKSLTILPDSLPAGIIRAYLFPDTLPASMAAVWQYRPHNYLFMNGWGDTSQRGRYMSLLSADTLSDAITYSADDSAKMLIPTKELFLYNKANVKYQDMNITAHVIHYNQGENLVRGYGGSDTSNNPLDMPTLVQNGSKSIMDTFTINIKNQKGLTKNTYYNEGELFVHSAIVKKIDKKTVFAWDGRFTTCNLDTPHFDFRAKKIKMIQNSIAVSGPAYPEFEGVPMPIMIPFGIYPLTRGRHSGFLPPQFANNDSYGLGLEGLGYYRVINDNWDVTTRANIYTYGGYLLTVNPRYYNRYHYSGNLSLQIQKTKTLNQSGAYSDQEFTVGKSFQVNWSHSMDSKARPGVSFSANVSAGSTQFNKSLANNAMRNIQNQMSSSITWAKTWGEGKYNLSLAGNHNQNNSTRLINVNVPTVNFSMNTIYPLAKKEIVGTPKWYEKLGISYTGTAINQIAFYDSSFTLKRLLDTAQVGATHSIPITLSLPAVGPLIFSPSVSYSENWYTRKMHRNWDSTYQRVDTSAYRGFYQARQMSFGMSMNTRIFGTYNFNKDSKIVAIRHEIRPTISASYQPDMNKNNYEWLRYNNNTRTVNGRTVYGDSMRVSKFSGNVVGAFGEGAFGGLNFGIDNVLEMKVKNDKDSTGDPDKATKKVKLIDGLSITSGYNFLADSLRWQPVNFSLRTTLFNKVNITSSAVLNQYETDSLGRTINKLAWAKGKLGHFTTGSIAFSTSLQSKKTDNKSDAQRIPDDPTMSYDDQQRQLDYIRSNPAEFVDFNIPWNLSASFALNFSRTLASDYSRYITNISSSLNLNGDFSITENWKAGGNMMLDVKAKKVQILTLFFTREMHCWQMSINITPIGTYRSFSIVLNPKAGLLRDLRINRSRYFYNN